MAETQVPTNFPSVSDLNARGLHSVTSTTDETIAWLRKHGLLASVMNCTACGHPARECSDSKRNDGKRWRCRVKACGKDISIRHGSFFGESSKLQLTQMLDLLYFYAYENATFKNISRECRMASEAIVKWRNFTRDIFAEHLTAHSVRIGGPGEVVEIDESALFKRNYQVGKLVCTQWVFGGVQVGNKNAFLVAVPNCDAATLLPTIQEFVIPGSTIVSDLWAAYKTTENPGYDLLAVNDSIRFVDPQTHVGVATNHMEGMWCHAKQRKRESGTRKPHLIEFMWRRSFGDDPFQNLLTHIREVYPV
ncbi:hypothetical protein ElyMa_002442000 [Elysia marginata]|uniref:ISXO2-like transposase domain-containing protein n=1 Tax=Elysia marginata TaxID=1093978 RepID=A0AAV4GJ56_9GAST|nr:hypothetical protein ElyMa_002442000 [Elysia marginata]